jgi:2,3-bisphosphoglycerate-independent phosphoglycerate mutase
VKRKVVLCILDGWGIASDIKYNGLQAATFWPELLKKYPHTQLQASEIHVGLPDLQMGNSEVGHMTMGLGRVIFQDLPKIDQQFTDGSINNNPSILNAIEQLKNSHKPCHVMGLLSPGGVHSHMRHMINAAKLLAAFGIKIFVHGFLDGRDTPPQSAAAYVEDLLNEIKDYPNIQLVSLCGRYYSMDRDNRWDRIELAYDALVMADAPKFEDAIQAIKYSYTEGVTDEFMKPTVHENYAGIQDGDGLWMINFRADRVRQLLRGLLLHDFKLFNRKQIVKFGVTLAMNDYAEDLSRLIPSIFAKDKIEKSLGEIIADHNLKQMRISETEKYAHVTFFLNGGREQTFEGEERVMIPSPSVATYDLQPEMSAEKVTETVCNAMERDDLSLIVVNYANTDMVGHTGVIEAIHKAVSCVDNCLKVLEQKAIEQNWVLLITADHGNVECMREADGVTPHTAHTCNPVPLVQVNGPAKSLHKGTLADVAPTILDIMGITQPVEMTGKSCLM